MPARKTKRLETQHLTQAQIELFAHRCGVLDGEAPLRILFEEGGLEFERKTAAMAALLAAINSGQKATFAYALSLGYADRADLESAIALAVDVEQLDFAEHLADRLRSMDEKAWLEKNIQPQNAPRQKSARL